MSYEEYEGNYEIDYNSCPEHITDNYESDHLRERNNQRMKVWELNGMPGFRSDYDINNEYRGSYANSLYCERDEDRKNESNDLYDVWAQATSTEGKLQLSKLRKRLKSIEQRGKQARNEDKPGLRKMYRETKKAVEWMETFHMNKELNYDEEITWWTKANNGGRIEKLRETESVNLLHKAVIPMLAKGKFENGFWFKRFVDRLELNRKDISAAWKLWADVHNRELKRGR